MLFQTIYINERLANNLHLLLLLVFSHLHTSISNAHSDISFIYIYIYIYSQHNIQLRKGKKGKLRFGEFRCEETEKPKVI